MYRAKFEVILLSGGFATRLGFCDVSAKSSQFCYHYKSVEIPIRELGSG